VFKYTVPTPPDGLVETVGSEDDFVISLGRLVSDAPDIAGKAPVNLLAATPAIFPSVISPSNMDSVVIRDIAIMLYPFFIIFGWIYC
jgi:CRISPR/Cas system CMR-associated protein Cmr3 (group 5 of RAMP superfamily)